MDTKTLLIGEHALHKAPFYMRPIYEVSTDSVNLLSESEIVQKIVNSSFNISKILQYFWLKSRKFRASLSPLAGSAKFTEGRINYIIGREEVKSIAVKRIFQNFTMNSLTQLYVGRVVYFNWYLISTVAMNLPRRAEISDTQLNKRWLNEIYCEVLKNL